MISAIMAARRGKSVLLLEKLSKLGAKLKATGGGRCNLTNTLPNEEFMARFGREGRFMTPALNAFDHKKLRAFLQISVLNLMLLMDTEFFQPRITQVLFSLHSKMR